MRLKGGATDLRLKGGATARAVADRATSADLLNLAMDVGPVPLQAGACLVLETGPDSDLALAQRLIAERIRAVPRLRQRLVPMPPGCGRPV